jgi:hypothetical protein
MWPGVGLMSIDPALLNDDEYVLGPSLAPLVSTEDIYVLADAARREGVVHP